MKRLFVLVLSATLIFFLAACGNTPKDETSISDSQGQTTSENGQPAQDSEEDISSVDGNEDVANDIADWVKTLGY